MLAALAHLVVLKAHLLALAHLVVEAQVPVPALAHLVVEARLVDLAHKVVEAEVLLHLLSRQSFSAAMARSTP